MQREQAESATDNPMVNLEAVGMHCEIHADNNFVEEPPLLTNIAPDWCPVDRVTIPYNGIDEEVKTA